MIDDIERNQHFKYPKLYRRLYDDGMLYTGRYGEDWQTKEYPKIKERPTLLFYGNDFELLMLDSVEKKIENFRDNYGNKELRFIPFAQNGAGDLYCFYLNDEKDGDISIVFVLHDCDKAKILAKNLQDFIFRGLLEAVVEIYDDGWSVNEIKSMLKTHVKYLSAKAQAIVSGIYARDVFDYSYKLPNSHAQKTNGLLTYDELETILKNEIYFEDLGKKFAYQEAKIDIDN